MSSPRSNLATTLFATQALMHPKRRAALRLVFGMVVAAAVLDWAENHHFLVMLASLRADLPVDPVAAQMQMELSMLKWHLAYAAFFVLGLVLPTSKRLHRLLAVALVWIQLPVGVLFYAVTDAELHRILLWGRYLNLWSGFVLLAAYFRGLVPSALESDSAPPP